MGGHDVPVTIRVFVLDDHEIVRRGVRELLETDSEIEVVGEAGTAQEGLARIAELLPDVALLDVRLPDESGVEVCREIRSSLPEVACLMLTSYNDNQALLDSVIAGASGYVLKQVRGNDILDAVRRTAAGETLLDPAVVDEARQRIRGAHDDEVRLASLTAQERRILDLLADGLSNRQIADELYLAEKTVKNYVSNLLMKMNMSRRTEAAVYAARQAERNRGT